MAAFLTDLVSSIFTPGPTPSLIIATNVSFAGLQLVLFALVLLTHSIHFLILSCFCAGLWWAINWFVRELQAATEKEQEAKRLKEVRKEKEEKDEESGTETEGGSQENLSRSMGSQRLPESRLEVDDKVRELRQRRSMGSASEGLSTDSEWDKVEAEGDGERSTA